jgi:hypothetical protein
MFSRRLSARYLPRVACSADPLVSYDPKSNPLPPATVMVVWLEDTATSGMPDVDMHIRIKLI